MSAYAQEGGSPGGSVYAQKGSAGGGTVVLGPPAPANLFGKSGQTAAKAATKTAPPPVKVVKVRAHTRTIPVKTKPAPQATPAATPAAVTTTPSVRPGEGSTAKRFAPNFAAEPVAGHVPFLQNPDRSWVAPGGKFQPGAHIALRPYYTNTNTLSKRAGPSGQESTQWNAATAAKAKQMQVANYGKPGYIARSLVPGGLDQSGTTSVAKAITRGVEAGTAVLPGGGAREAAGVLGFGLKAITRLRAAKDVVEAAPAVARAAVPVEKVAPHVTPAGSTEGVGSVPSQAHEPGYLYHRAPASSFKSVSERGLHPSKPAGPNPSGVYFGNEPLQAAGLSWKRGGVYYRVDPKNVADRTERAFGESVTPHSVPAKHVEYLGKDGAWHPVQTTAPAAAHATEAGATIRAGLPGAKIVRGKQEAGYTPARAERVAAGQAHLDNPNLSASEAFAKARAEQRGPLPKINFLGFGDLNEKTLQEAQASIRDHPNLGFYQKLNASHALVNALGGTVPTRSELLLLEHVFGKGTGNGLVELAKHPGREALLNALNIPRSLMSSFDLSAPFRQGLMVATRHPKIFTRNFGTMVKAFGSDAVHQGVQEEIRARPTYPLMVDAKLPLTDLGRDIGNREEQFPSNYAETLTGGKYSPVRASGRAYTTFLDKTRADVFDHLIQRAQNQDVNVHDQHFLESLGTYIGSATGRGQLRHFEQSAKALNTFLFSPRLLASRLNFLNPAYYARLHPFARKEALRSALQLAGTVSTMLALASRVPGVKVNLDPRNPDWGKIRIGNTRIDIAGGFQQPLRLLAQFGTGVAISSTTGKSLSLTAGGFGKPTRLDIVQRFFEGKASPLASLALDWMRGTDLVGQKLHWGSANPFQNPLGQRLTPLLAQDAHDLYNEKHGGMNGIMAALAGYGVGSVGLGLQTYAPKAPKTKLPLAPAQGPTSGSIYAGKGSSYAGSSYAGSGSSYAGK